MPSLVPQSERGASAILIAASMLLLMGMAAIAIDVGNGFTERRQAQSGADFAVLAAVPFATPLSPADDRCAWAAPDTTSGSPGDAYEWSKCRGAVEAIDVVDANLPSASLDWASCTSIDPTADFDEIPSVDLDGPGPGSETEVDCIRFNMSLQSGQVSVPRIEVDTSFGRVLGVDAIGVSALAEAGGDLGIAFRIFPFGIPANATGSLECLKEGAVPQWGICEDAEDETETSNGNFRFMDIPIYANGCSTTNETLKQNIIHGIDHFLGTHVNGTPTQGNPARRDDSSPNDSLIRQYVCPIFTGLANEIGSQTGNISGVFDLAMLDGDGTGRGPLWKDTADGGLVVRNAQGQQDKAEVDNTPLWDHLKPGACPGANDAATLEACLDNWTSGIIFEESITESGRFGYAPFLHEPFSSASWYFIKEMVPVYLHVSFFGCSEGQGGTCGAVHEPGIASTTTCGTAPQTSCGLPAKGTEKLNAVTSFILKEGMVPLNARIPFQEERPLLHLALTR